MKSVLKIILNVFLWVMPLMAYAANGEGLQVSVLKPPIPVQTNQGEVLVYELSLLNKNDQPVRVGRVEVWGDNHLLESYAGDRLIHNSFMYGEAGKGRRFKIELHTEASNGLEGGRKGFVFEIQKKKPNQYVKKETVNFIELQKGMGAFIYIWVSVKNGQKIPKQLHHKIWQVFPDAEKNHFTSQILNYSLTVSQKKPAVLGQPLRGKDWIAAGALSPDSYHRRTVLPIKNKFYLAQRYAIDWIQICPNGREEKGGLKDNQHWNAFGHEVLAPIDGIVTQVHDGVKENTPPGLPPLPPFEDISGNHVILKFHQNKQDYYLMYAHMQPGSIRVKKGDEVKEGQVLGLLGNTGNSSQPHLHMQVMDANSPLQAEGIPFVFKKVGFLGKAQQIDTEYGLWKPFHSSASPFKAMIPTENQVFQFTHEKTKACGVKSHP